ncbi:hypothetical protein QYN14_00090 [Rhodococcus ruber]|uniref:hypothetical protein n=1 Tax=Rhodococcus ruber TaxID=1830 RepID=UPI00265832C7|nr:hypothetical protein [Rhodococcus ruber]WKK11984.1 hypothetical protein QYN14_25480 [Rhodococcus ruber]WKK12057.1 hypothetical protein QYN14_00090 [Rhodococcus ruber]
MTTPETAPAGSGPAPTDGVPEAEALAFKDLKERVGRSVERSSVIKVGVWSLTQGPPPDGTEDGITLIATNTLTGTQTVLAPPDDRMQILEQKLAEMQQSMNELTERVTTAESDINSIESDINSIESDINGLERDIRDCNC